jgi:predicted enzyme related to lactoylglutathione lyase
LTTDRKERDVTLGTQAHHRIDYIELSVHDMKVVQRFYYEAFGWTFTDYGPDYAGIKLGDKEMGGLRVDAEGRGGSPLVILYSGDLGATLQAVEAAGGTISTPPFEFPGGRRFHFTDPSGNELAVWSES